MLVYVRRGGCPLPTPPEHPATRSLAVASSYDKSYNIQQVDIVVRTVGRVLNK